MAELGTEHVAVTVGGEPMRATDEERCRHAFVCGMTGSGKTNLMLAMAEEGIARKEGLVYVDGKGDATVLSRIHEIAGRHGRAGDVMVLNFNAAPVEGGERRSNTINPFATCDARTVSDIVVSCMEDTTGEGAMWKGRSVMMVGVVTRVLAWLRDEGLIALNGSSIRDHLNLRKIIDFSDPAAYPGMPAGLRSSVAAYLTSLPGYVAEKKYKQSHTALDQHGFLEMQATRATTALADDYAHVFARDDGEVHMDEIHAGKRILVVLLPTVARPRYESAFLGRLVLTLLRELLAGKLRQREDLAFEGRTPEAEGVFNVILDEFSHYVTPDIEPMVAQARSFGFSFAFASQTTVPGASDPDGRAMGAVVSACGTKYLMRVDGRDAMRMRDFFVVDHAEHFTLTGLPPGEGLMLRGGDVRLFAGRDMSGTKGARVRLNPGRVSAAVVARDERIARLAGADRGTAGFTDGSVRCEVTGDHGDERSGDLDGVELGLDFDDDLPAFDPGADPLATVSPSPTGIGIFPDGPPTLDAVVAVREAIRSCVVHARASVPADGAVVP